MGALTMSKDEREEFLADVHIGVLTVQRPDGPPLAAPVWYRYQPGGIVELTTEAASAKAQLLTAAGSASLCVQREETPYAYVTVEGPVTIGHATRETRIEIAVRYLGDAKGNAYVESTAFVDDTLVQLAPERWRTSDYAKLNLGSPPDQSG